MTAPALPPEVESHVVAVDALLDAVRKFVKKDTPTGLMRLNDAMVAARDSTAALRAAIARALGGDGEPVAWGVFDKNDCLWRSFDSQRDAERESASLNAREDTGHYRACGPYRVEPLSFTRPAATGDTGEGERAKVAAWEAAHDSLRDDVLHNADGFDNDIVNHYLGMIDDADQRPYTHIATKGGPDAR